MSDSEELNYERRPEYTKDTAPDDEEIQRSPSGDWTPRSPITSAREHENNEKRVVVDHQGLQTPVRLHPQEEVVYDVLEKPEFHVTRALFVGNLRRPLDASDFQNYLKHLVSEASVSEHEPYGVERAWLNRTRTHGIVLLSTEDAAIFVREKLNGSIYPSPEEDAQLKEEFERREEERYDIERSEYERALADRIDREIQSPTAAEDIDVDEPHRSPIPNHNAPAPALEEPVPPREYITERLELYVDFMPVKAINQWIFEEDRGPKNGKWKVTYEPRNEDVIARHTMLEGDFLPRFTQRRSNFRGGRGGMYSGPRRGGHGGPISVYGARDDRGYKDNGPRPYNLPPPPTSGRPPRSRANYYAERDSYVPRQSAESRTSYSRSRRNIDSYQPRGYRDRDSRGPERSRSRSRSPGF